MRLSLRLKWALLIPTVFFLATIGSANNSKPKVVLGASPEINIVNKDGSGIYRDIVELVLGDRYEIEFQVGPWARMEKLLIKGKIDGFAGTDLHGFNETDRQGLLRPKWPLEFSPVTAAFLAKKYSKWDNELLKTARLVWLNGYAMESNIPFKVNFKEVATDAAGVGMLAKDRADVFLSYEESIEEALTEFPDVELLMATTSIAEELHLVLRKSPRHETIAALWDERNNDIATQQKITNIWKDSSIEERFVSEHFFRQLPRQKPSNNLEQISGVYGGEKEFTAIRVEKDLTVESFYTYMWEGELISGIATGRYDPETATMSGTWCEAVADDERGPIEMIFYRKGDAVLMDSLYITDTNPGEWYLDNVGNRKTKPVPNGLFEKIREDVDPKCLKSS